MIVTTIGAGCTCETAGAVLDFDCYLQRWTGSVRCGDLVIGISAYVTKDPEYDQCRLYLETDCTNPGIVSVLMAAPSAAPADAYGPECGSLTYSWTFTDFECGDANCTELEIAVSARDTFALADTECGEECEGCRCACRTLCITYSSNSCEETVKVSGNGVWPFSFDCAGGTITGTIRLTSSVYGVCGLLLESADLGDGDLIPQSDCPELAGSWIIGEGAGSASLTVRCGGCGPCAAVDYGCCDFTKLGVECPSTLSISLCGCSGTLTLEGGGGCWSWSGAITCGVDGFGNPRTYGVSLDCIGESEAGIYRLSIVTCPDNGPDVITFDAQLVNCDPFLLMFSISGMDCAPCGEPFTAVITR